MRVIKVLKVLNSCGVIRADKAIIGCGVISVIRVMNMCGVIKAD
jgi:hypothetical protein